MKNLGYLLGLGKSLNLRKAHLAFLVSCGREFQGLDVCNTSPELLRTRPPSLCFELRPRGRTNQQGQLETLRGALPTAPSAGIHAAGKRSLAWLRLGGKPLGRSQRRLLGWGLQQAEGEYGLDVPCGADAREDGLPRAQLTQSRVPSGPDPIQLLQSTDRDGGALPRRLDLLPAGQVWSPLWTGGERCTGVTPSSGLTGLLGDGQLVAGSGPKDGDPPGCHHCGGNWSSDPVPPGLCV